MSRLCFKPVGYLYTFCFGKAFGLNGETLFYILKHLVRDGQHRNLVIDEKEKIKAPEARSVLR